MQQNNDQWLASQNFEDITQTSWDGVTLLGRILRAEQQSHIWVITIHGFDANGLHEGTPARHFHVAGYSVF